MGERGKVKGGKGKVKGGKGKGKWKEERVKERKEKRKEERKFRKMRAKEGNQDHQWKKCKEEKYMRLFFCFFLTNFSIT